MSQPHVKVSSLADFASIVPMVLGFHPERSVVLCVVNDVGIVGPVARIDWIDNEDGRLAVLDTLHRVNRYGAVTAFTFGLEPMEAEAVFHLLDGLVEKIGRVFADTCMDLHTFEGGPVSFASAPATELVGHGMASWHSRNREDMARVVAVDPEWRDQVAAYEGVQPTSPEFLAIHLISAAEWGPDITARHLAALQYPKARDAVWAALTSETAENISKQFTSLLRAAEGVDEVGPWAALAMASTYATGNGALTNAISERQDVADAIAGGAGLARTLREAFDDAIHPDALLDVVKLAAKLYA